MAYSVKGIVKHFGKYAYCLSCQIRGKSCSHHEVAKQPAETSDSGVNSRAHNHVKQQLVMF